MKKVFFVLLASLAVAGGMFVVPATTGVFDVGITAKAAALVGEGGAIVGDYIVGDYISNGVTGVYIQGYKGTAVDLVIPSELEGKPVFDIEDEAFSGCETLRSVTIPEGILVSQGAFQNCKNLQSVQFLGNSLLSIENRAFAGCTSLQRIELPESVQKIDSEAFAGCTSLQQVKLSSNLISIGESAFSGCCKLKDIKLNKGLDCIASFAFSGCTSLTDITIPDSVVILGEGAFYQSGLQQITIGKGILQIEVNTFEGCTNLKTVKGCKRVCTISAEAFKDCKNLETLAYMDWLQSIGDAAFKNCVKLKTITWGKKLTYIEDETFSNCRALEKVNFSESTVGIGAGAFRGCSSLTEVDIPDGTLSIGIRAFFESGVQRVYVGAGITELPSKVFSCCADLKLVEGCKNVKTLGEEAFSFCPTLVKVHFTDNLEYVGPSVFRNCYKLCSVELGQRVETIADNAFMQCWGLFDIDLPSSLKSIGKYAFYDCALMQVRIPDSVTTIGANSFMNCPSLTAVAFGTGLKSIPANSFCGSGLLSVTIPDNIEVVERSAFDGSYNLRSVSFGSGLKEIKKMAFFDCYNLNNVEVPEGVIVADDAFAKTTIKNLSEIEYKTNYDYELGDTIVIHAKAKGVGTGYKYALYYRLLEGTDTAWHVVQSFKTNETILFKPAKLGAYEICIKAKDMEGHIAKMYRKLSVVSSPITNLSTLSSDNIKAGGTVTVYGNAVGGVWRGEGKDDARKYYAVYYKKTESTKWTKVQGYKENDTLSFVIKQAGTYDVCVKVKNTTSAYGVYQEDKKYFTVTVK